MEINSKSISGALNSSANVSADHSKVRGSTSATSEGGISEILRDLKKRAEIPKETHLVFGAPLEPNAVAVPEGWANNKSRRVDIGVVAKEEKAGKAKNNEEKVGGDLADEEPPIDSKRFKPASLKKRNVAHVLSSLSRIVGADPTSQFAKKNSMFQQDNFEKLSKKLDDFEEAEDGLKEDVDGNPAPAKQFPAHLRDVPLFKDGKFERQFNKVRAALAEGPAQKSEAGPSKTE